MRAEVKKLWKSGYFQNFDIDNLKILDLCIFVDIGVRVCGLISTLDGDFGQFYCSDSTGCLNALCALTETSGSQIFSRIERIRPFDTIV